MTNMDRVCEDSDESKDDDFDESRDAKWESPVKENNPEGIDIDEAGEELKDYPHESMKGSICVSPASDSEKIAEDVVKTVKE